MIHVVLCGDSIFDNKSYVEAHEPDVATQLRGRLDDDSRVTLLAVDGHVTSDVCPQLDRLPSDATHIVVSGGGNDALGFISILGERVGSVGEALETLSHVAEDFESEYRDMLDHVLGLDRPTAVCTIYHPRFDMKDWRRLVGFEAAEATTEEKSTHQRQANAALTFFNDAITRIAFQAGVPVLDLRLICNDDTDYANPIEPSARGGEKISSQIAEFVREATERSERSWILR
jgi:hypothetical protein